jgi:hypothetical protein
VLVTSRWIRAWRSTSREPGQGGGAGGPSAPSSSGSTVGLRSGLGRLQYPRAGGRWQSTRARRRAAAHEQPTAASRTHPASTSWSPRPPSPIAVPVRAR